MTMQIAYVECFDPTLNRGYARSPVDNRLYQIDAQNYRLIYSPTRRVRTHRFSWRKTMIGRTPKTGDEIFFVENFTGKMRRAYRWYCVPPDQPVVTAPKNTDRPQTLYRVMAIEWFEGTKPKTTDQKIVTQGTCAQITKKYPKPQDPDKPDRLATFTDHSGLYRACWFERCDQDDVWVRTVDPRTHSRKK